VKGEGPPGGLMSYQSFIGSKDNKAKVAHLPKDEQKEALRKMWYEMSGKKMPEKRPKTAGAGRGKGGARLLVEMDGVMYALKKL
jgi:hypothetical protein